jgi:hypothetical protein
MENESNAKYVSYDIEKYFSRSPISPSEGWTEGPARCPMCAGSLSETTMEPSKAMSDLNLSTEETYWLDHGWSFLYTCNQCRWWCVREHYEFVIKKHADHKFGRDYLIVSKTEIEKPEIFGDVPAHHAQPWLKALVDPEVYNKVQKLPEELAVLFKRV